MHVASDLLKQFDLPIEEIQQAAKEGYVKALTEGLVDEVDEIKNEYQLPDEFIQSESVKEAAIKALSKLGPEYKLEADKIKLKYDLT